MSLDLIRIVLVRTFHPGNIGAAARSMKTMGLSDLCLVSPREFPSADANKMAAGAANMLDRVRVVESLPEAIADCTVVIASTARARSYDLPEVTPEGAAQMLLDGARNSPVALLFGPERMGLHNRDIKHAKYRLTIPSNPFYSSLNMAAAVQILSYEIFKAAQRASPVQANPARQLPSSDDIERLHSHFEEVLHEVQFLRTHQGETLQRLRNLISRAQPDVLETNILRGILSAVQKALTRS